MLGSVHLLFGALIGLLFADPAVIVVIAFFSHYILDFLPHVDPETFIAGNQRYSNIGRLTLISDIFVIGLLTALMIATQSHWQYMLLGAMSAQIPDWLIPLQRYSFFVPFKRLHQLAHWDVRRAQYWHWYITGLLSPALIGLLCLWLLW